MNKVKLSSHWVTVTAPMHRDLDTMAFLLNNCNCKNLCSSIRRPTLTTSHNTVDACGFGIGGFHNGVVWQSYWPSPMRWMHSNLKELVGAVVHVCRFAPQWRGYFIQLGSDNTDTIGWITRGSGRPPEIMPWLKLLFWTLMHYDISLEMIYVPGIQNQLADCASRFKQQELARLLTEWHGSYTPIKLDSTPPDAILFPDRNTFMEQVGILGDLLQEQ